MAFWFCVVWGLFLFLVRGVCLFVCLFSGLGLLEVFIFIWVTLFIRNLEDLSMYQFSKCLSVPLFVA